jgi:hypothetical protein
VLSRVSWTLGGAACVGGLVVFACAGGVTPRPPERTVDVAVRTDRAEYAAGEPIGLTLTVTNQGEAPVVFAFSSGQRYDFVVLSASGDTVWQWSAGMGFVQMLGGERVEPGAALEYREEFRGALTPGAYTVLGTLTARPTPLDAEATFRVRG